MNEIKRMLRELQMLLCRKINIDNTNAKYSDYNENYSKIIFVDPVTKKWSLADPTGGTGGSANSYSTTETLTGGTWIDWKPIYRKTFSILTTLYSDNIVLSGLDIEEIVSSSSVLNVENSIQGFIPVPFTSSTLQNLTTPTNGIYLVKESVGYKIYNDEERIEVECVKYQYSMIDASMANQEPLYPNGKLYITLEYTKTTD